MKKLKLLFLFVVCLFGVFTCCSINAKYFIDTKTGTETQRHFIYEKSDLKNLDSSQTEALLASWIRLDSSASRGTHIEFMRTAIEIVVEKNPDAKLILVLIFRYNERKIQISVQNEAMYISTFKGAVLYEFDKPHFNKGNIIKGSYKLRRKGTNSNGVNFAWEYIPKEAEAA